MSEIKGRLGLKEARVPQKDRHGLLWLGRGQLFVDSGTLRFLCAGFQDMKSGDYSIPFQMLNCLILQPGTSITHDVLRLCAAHGTGIVAVSEGGTRLFASAPFGPNNSVRARKHAELWSNNITRINVAKQMYYFRFGEILEGKSLNDLRGVEGSRMRQMYKNFSTKYGVQWFGRKYDRENPENTNDINSAINHAVTAVEGAALTAVAITGAIPQLGFIHEAAGHSFTLDITDLYRDLITLPVAFQSTQIYQRDKSVPLERLVRRGVAKQLVGDKIIASMIDNIKKFIDDTGI